MIARTLDLARTRPAAASAAAIAVIAVTTILGAYFFQYVLGYRPCPLCLEQRIAYYISIPLAAMILLGLSVGSSRKVLSDPSAGDFTWSPDGTRVAYYSRHDREWGVWIAVAR